MGKQQNAVGAVLRKLRVERDLSQEELAGKLQLLGMEKMSRAVLSKIEAHLRCVTDLELLKIARALGVEITDLYPPAMLPKRRGQRRSH